MKRLLLIGILLCPSIVLAAQNINIAVIVGDEVITNYDIEQRLALVAASSAIKIDNTNRKRFMQQIAKIMSDEVLQEINAKQYGVEVSEVELNEALADIAKRNNIKPNKMGEFLKNKGISRAIFVTQLRSQLLWRNIVLSRVRSQVKISEVEVADVIEALQSSDTNIEVSLEQIILPIAYDVSHGEVQKLANNLYKSITEEGADFNSLAGQFSQGQALKINNINLAQLNGEVREALAGLEKGDVSKPFRSSDGYHILKLIKKQVKDNNIITEAEKDKVRQNLFMQKLELEAKKYMRDLRRAIFVETKL